MQFSETTQDQHYEYPLQTFSRKFGNVCDQTGIDMDNPLIA